MVTTVSKLATTATATYRSPFRKRPDLPALTFVGEAMRPKGGSSVAISQELIKGRSLPASLESNPDKDSVRAELLDNRLAFVEARTSAD